MKYLLILLIFTANSAYAQFNIGPKITNMGAGVEVGYLIRQRVLVSLDYQRSIVKAPESPSFASLTSGWKIAINNTLDITPLIGAAYVINTSWDDKDVEIVKKEFKFEGGIEIGASNHIGQLYTLCGYNKNLFFGIGMRFFP